MEKIRREKKVVVPTRIQTRWPNMNHETNAPHSSAFQGRISRIDIHLNLTFILDQKPVAAASSSSFVGLLGSCRYLDTDAAIESDSACDRPLLGSVAC